MKTTTKKFMRSYLAPLASLGLMVGLGMNMMSIGIVKPLENTKAFINPLANVNLDNGTQYPAGVLFSAETVSVNEILTPDMLRITFPSAEVKYPNIPAITGEIQGNSQNVEKVMLRIYNNTKGAYFDGTSFTKKDFFEVEAYGTNSFIYKLPTGALDDDRFIIAARAVMKNGSSIDFANKITFDVDSAVKPSATNTLPSATTNSTSTTVPTTSTTVTKVNGQPATSDWRSQLTNIVNAYQPKAELFSAFPTSASELKYAPTMEQVTTTTTTTVTTSGTVLPGTESMLCQAPDGTKSLSSDSMTTFLREVCGNPVVMQNLLQLTPEESYNVKFKEYTERNLVAQNANPALNTIGLRDSDTDGVSDKLELLLRTDPFLKDTDKDGAKDGDETLMYGTNPNDAQSIPGKGLVITNIRDGMRTKDRRTVIVGAGIPATMVKIYEMKDKVKSDLIGQGLADADGKFVIEPAFDLADGEHTVRAYQDVTASNTTIESQSVTFIIDQNINFPAPIVVKITSEGLRPQVFGTTVFGSTVIGHFQSVVESSAVLTDTKNGDFIVTSSTALDPGNHIVTLYATLPNGVRSEKVRVPFILQDLGAESTFILPAWAYFTLSPLLLGGFLACMFFVLRRRDMVLFNIEKSELVDIEKTEKSGRFTFTSPYPVKKKDLYIQYIAFQLNGWNADTAMPLKKLLKAKEGYLYPMCKIDELWVIPADGKNPLNITQGEDVPYLKGASIQYVFSLLTEEDKQWKEFAGKRYGMMKSILKGVKIAKQPVALVEKKLPSDNIGIKITDSTK